MIYEARVTGKYGTRYWVQIPTKYGQQDVGPIKATGLVSPSIGQIVYVGYLPTADTFVILAGPEGAPVVSWGDIADKPSTFTPSAHNHSATNITSGTLSAARLPVVTSSANGAMLAADKVKLDAATLNSTADTIAMRDSSGRLATQAPTGPTHAANKTYVDAQVALKAPLSHSHEWADLPTPIELDGTTDFNTLTTRNTYHQSSNSEAATAPNSPSQYAGFLRVENMSTTFVYQWYFEYGPARKIYYRAKYGSTWYAWRELTFWDSASMTTSNNSLVQRTAAGNIYGNVYLSDAAQSTASNALTRKDYVDAQVATRAPSAHSHAWGDLTGVPSTFTPSSHNHSASNITSGTLAAARLPVVTSSANGAMLAADKVKLDGAGYDAGPSKILMTSSADFAKAGAFFVSLTQQTQAHALTRKDYVDGLAAGLQSSKLDKALIEIGDAADLNTYTTTGDYHQGANTRAANGSNYPTPYAGKLEVKTNDSGTFVYQEYTGYNSTGRKFYRCKYNTTWYAWKEVGVRTAPAVWETLALNTTNFGLYGNGYAEITEDNGLVTLAAVLTPKSAVLSELTTTTGQHALTIPSKYIPSKTNAAVWLHQGSGQNKFVSSLETDGKLTLGRYGPGAPTTSAWLPIYISWRL